VTVEFALIAPLLATLVLGTFEVGRQTMAKQMLSEAARAGCRMAILPAADNASVIARVSEVLTRHGIDVGLATITIQVNNVTVDAATAKRNDTVSVEVGVPFSAVSWTNGYFFIPADAMQSEKIVMMREG
jgi:Flp pilus assembly protein TadG